MNCRRVKKRLNEYVDGTLAGDARDEVAAHLDGCPECAGVLAKMESAHSALATLETKEMTDETTSKMLAVLRAARPQRRNAGAFLRSSTGLAVGAAVVMVIIATVVVVTVHPWSRTSEQPAVTRQALEAPEQGYAAEEKEYKDRASTQVSVSGALPGSAEKLATETPPQPVVTVSDKDYDENTLREAFQKMPARKQFATDYNISDIVRLSPEFHAAIDEQFKSKSAGDTGELNLMFTYLTNSEPLLLPYYVEKARFKGNEAWIIGLCGPGKDTSKGLQRTEVWVMDPKKFMQNPDSGVVYEVTLLNEQ